MAGTKEIKRRIKSVKNTKKITKAMELVAASKMKRAVNSTLASRLYAEYSWNVLTSISANVEEISSPLFVERERRDGWKNVLLILITSNRGLCGAYNAQVIKKTISLLKEQNQKTNVDVLSIGKKGDVGMRRVGKNVIASFNELGDQVTLANVLPISKMVLD
ncbi:F0F1 ATP synthase subunit gamma [Candidatus Nomurabacteria bacterium]|nr:F0F1 ATP synthase subunit gamma [Candidatus Nomurabacteria bacterium]